jgi:CxxC motif-containing protein
MNASPLSVSEIREIYPTYYARRKAVSRGLCNRLSPGDYQRAKTQCPQGHNYSEDNTFVRANGKRECKTCMRVRNAARSRDEFINTNREWKKRNREKAAQTSRNCSLKRRFGITLQDYERLNGAQAGVCAICCERCPTGFNLAVDHDHKTKRVRGLLCARCNTGIGQFQDKPERLMAAAAYLSRAVTA